MTTAHSSSFEVKNKVTEYVLTNNQWPTSMTELGYEFESVINEVNNYQIDIYDKGMIGIKVGLTGAGEDKYIVLEPELIDSNLTWKCYGQNIESSQLPNECR